MKLNLKKPIIFFDLETTGLSITQDRIVQIGYIKVMPNGEEEEGNLLINPEQHIPDEASNIHHITDDMVKDKPTFKELAGKLKQIFMGCDLAGYNSNRFDIPFLIEEFYRAGVDIDFDKAKMVDVQNIFYKKEPRTLTAAYRFYCGKTLDGAHSADADIRATYEVLQAQLERYDSDADNPLQNEVEWLHDYCRMNRNVDPMGTMVYDDQMRPCFNFGKHKGKLVRNVFEKDDPNFYSWMKNGDFALSTKKCIDKIKFSILTEKKNHQ